MTTTKKQPPVFKKEHDAQAACVVWARHKAAVYPELRLLFNSMNGVPLPPRIAAKMSAEGMNAGCPDLWLPVARQGYHGFAFELKIQGRKPRELQVAWLDALAKQGYYAASGSAGEFIDAIMWYLSLPEYERPAWY